MMKNLLILIACCCLGLQAVAQQLAFPGAEGFGRFATGGRGGAVLEVTNLNDAGPGSLRAAITAAGPRTVVFRVSGTIALASSLTIRNPGITIAGQTAPGDGITLKNYPVTVDADNVIIRYLRFRMGDEAQQEGDALGGRFHKNLIIDHCSMSWSTDECVSFYANENFTLQWSIISESLRNSAHAKGAHGYGGIWGGKNASFHHNLMAHHDSRNPRLGEEAGKAFALTDLVDVRNNVFYNWGQNSIYGGEAMNVNIVNNYYKPGPATSKKERIASLDKNKTPGTEVYDQWGKFYIDGNFVEGSPRTTADNWTYGVLNQFHSSYGTVSEADKASLRRNAPHPIQNNVVTHAAPEAYTQVLEKAGASLKRDAVDVRVIENVRQGTFTAPGSRGSTNGIIDSQQDVGGWPTLQSLPAPVDTDKDGMPDAWETQRGLNPNNAEDRNLDGNGDGYTNLEEYLNGLVLASNLTSSPEDSQLGSTGLIPNPFTTETTFTFVARQRGQAVVQVTDLAGKKVTTLLDASVSPGSHSVTWNGTNQAGQYVPSGLYLISAQLGKGKQTKRVAFVKK
ncbi:FlgD immunoglobulin-like domain containing protein [Rufibacter glacialis]|uniref:FlgD immunoglobulin-like domain containing protein n=1 Tax=Rufibacter glacialis TaxID=1259555 RepID=A0A5M8Q6C0_9BACT|nr:FlgD immunoglobulin-like domain containing protein [Rufibacter glacialis]KAA6430658.1 T9SS type A sorting domain-containing protein [Rufibacter glacialis]